MTRAQDRQETRQTKRRRARHACPCTEQQSQIQDGGQVWMTGQACCCSEMDDGAGEQAGFLRVIWLPGAFPQGSLSRRWAEPGSPEQNQESLQGSPQQNQDSVQGRAPAAPRSPRRLEVRMRRMKATGFSRGHSATAGHTAVLGGGFQTAVQVLPLSEGFTGC